MWDIFNRKQGEIEDEKQRQEEVIMEQLKALELDHELQSGKITQRGLVAKQMLEEEALRKEIERKEQQLKKENQQQQQRQNSNEEMDEKKKLSYIEMARLGYQEVINAIIRPPRANYKVRPETRLVP